jgi:hypothetical protein
MSAPVPATGVLNVNVSGPLPALPASAVQMSVSSGLMPVPLQLHELAGHATETRLLGPVSVTVIAVLAADTALKLAPSNVASAPSWDQLIESFAFWAAWDDTTTNESAQAVKVGITVAAISARSPNRRARLVIVEPRFECGAGIGPEHAAPILSPAGRCIVSNFTISRRYPFDRTKFHSASRYWHTAPAVESNVPLSE